MWRTDEISTDAVKEGTQDFVDWLLGTPLFIAWLILSGIIATILVRLILRRWTHRVSEQEATPEKTGRLRRLMQSGPAGKISAAAGLSSARRAQRTKAIASVIRSTSSIIIWTTVIIMALSELGADIAPLLASAGIVGLALGFGAQTLVKDFLSGMFMLVEDQYGVGDVVDLGTVNGTIEAVGLRVTKLRDANGTLWYIRNGEIIRVGNQTQEWSQAVVEVKIPYEQSIKDSRKALETAAQRVAADPLWEGSMLSKPDITGIESLTASGNTLRLSVRTSPARQWDIARQLRLIIKAEFDKAGLELAE